MLTIIIPCFNEGQNIELVINKTDKILENTGIHYEYLFIDDGSIDNTWENINKIAKVDKRVKAISFSRNYGKEAALQSGLNHATGDCVVIMDCDLQHPPDIIPEMYRKWEEGYEIVEGKKISRGKESFLHRMSANIFYEIMSSTIGIDMKNASDYKLLDRKAVNALNKYHEHCYFYRALSSGLGFKKAYVEFQVMDRTNGNSKWSLKSLIRYAINNITANTEAPLYMPSVIIMIISFLTMIFFLYRFNNIFSKPILYFIITTFLLIMGITSIMGIMGYYIGKIYQEVKNRPFYIIRELIGIERKES